MNIRKITKTSRIYNGSFTIGCMAFTLGKRFVRAAVIGTGR